MPIPFVDRRRVRVAPPPTVVTVNLQELIDRANAAMATMGATNANRRLIHEMGAAILALCKRIQETEGAHAPSVGTPTLQVQL